MRAGKIWGEDELIFREPLIEMHILTILPRARCSHHEHAHKVNGFYVISGAIDVVVEKHGYPLTDRTRLNAGDSMVVRPPERHHFVGVELARVIEVCFLDPLGEDIVREDCGRGP